MDASLYEVNFFGKYWLWVSWPPKDRRRFNTKLLHLTALSHWIRGSGLPAYDVSNTTRAPRRTVVSHGPQSIVAASLAGPLVAAGAAVVIGRSFPSTFTLSATGSIVTSVTCCCADVGGDPMASSAHTITSTWKKKPPNYQNDRLRVHSRAKYL